MKFVALLLSLCAITSFAQKKVDFSSDWATESFYTNGKNILEEVKHHDLSSFWISEGTITITKATRYAEPHPMNESVAPISIVAKYEFVEDPKSKYSGVFTGTFRSDFVYDPAKPDEYLLDNNGDDGYMNNTFVGVWTSKSGKQKKCIWGLERLPYTEDWDEGAGEIYVNKKYVKNGWQSYMKQVNTGKPGKKDEWWK
jgi:hypothetical protein